MVDHYLYTLGLLNSLRRNYQCFHQNHRTSLQDLHDRLEIDKLSPFLVVTEYKMGYHGIRGLLHNLGTVYQLFHHVLNRSTLSLQVGVGRCPLRLVL